jgi:hypothetical protein
VEIPELRQNARIRPRSLGLHPAVGKQAAPVSLFNHLSAAEISESRHRDDCSWAACSSSTEVVVSFRLVFAISAFRFSALLSVTYAERKSEQERPHPGGAGSV